MTTRDLTADERTAWKHALDLWGVDLHDPVVDALPSRETFAWFTFPPEVHVDPDMVARIGGSGHVGTVFAHEIGHHVLSPSTRLNSLKIRHQMARAMTATSPSFGGRADRAALLSNLWSDLIVNVRVAHLQRLANPGSEPDMVAFTRILTHDFRTAEAADSSPMWWVINRAYERLWSLAPGSLCHPDAPQQWRRRLEGTVEVARRAAQVPPDQIPVDVEARFRESEQKLQAARRARLLYEAENHPSLRADPVRDAKALADTVRTLAGDPIRGALPTGMILSLYLLLDIEGPRPGMGHGCEESDRSPATAAELAGVIGDARLRETPIHPVEARLDALTADAMPDSETEGAGQSLGVAQTLALYRDSDPHAVMAAWYQNEARPYVAPLLERGAGEARDSIPGPLATWDMTDDLADLDWPATLIASPVVVPGITTRRRTHQPDEPHVEKTPVSVDLYLDSSGSMRHPRSGSPAVLAGTILALSVLRAGGRMRVTSWSGAGQVAGDTVYTRDQVETMRQLTTYFGGGTTFPLDLLMSRYIGDTRGRRAERRHLVVLSDDGLTSFFGAGQDRFVHVATAVREVVDTATLIIEDRRHRVDDLAASAGYDVLHLDSMADAPAVCSALARRIASTPALETQQSLKAQRPLKAQQ